MKITKILENINDVVYKNEDGETGEELLNKFLKMSFDQQKDYLDRNMWKNYIHETTNMEMILWEAFDKKITFDYNIQHFILKEYGYEYIKDLYNIDEKLLGDVLSRDMKDSLYIRLEYAFENGVDVSDTSMKVIINNLTYNNEVEDLVRVKRRFNKPFSEQLQLELINKDPACITLIPSDELKPNVITQSLTKLATVHSTSEKLFESIVKQIFKTNTLAVNKWLRYFKNVRQK